MGAHPVIVSHYLLSGFIVLKSTSGIVIAERDYTEWGNIHMVTTMDSYSGLHTALEVCIQGYEIRKS